MSMLTKRTTPRASASTIPNGMVMAVFVFGNLLCTVASGYVWLMAARVITALCHGAFFGIASMLAGRLAPPEKKASAVALMFTGLTLANVLGVPIGTALGQLEGWRVTFFAVKVIRVISLTGLWHALPAQVNGDPVDLLVEVTALRSRRIRFALSATVLWSAS
ncbi:MFS transporter [Caballeronia sp. LjRoot34]|uniref:MFS transporter n=1 Tax=Caballeronia sp. LjRoot34 TaxID=3342325 RepID=UPI003ECD58F7